MSVGWPSTTLPPKARKRTQKKAPHVPGSPVTFIATRKLPYSMSVRAATTSPIGTMSSTVSDRTTSCKPASLPFTASPAQSHEFLSGFVITFSSVAIFPYAPRAALELMLYTCGVQPMPVRSSMWRKSVSNRSVQTVCWVSVVLLTE